jgi:hypothetical protein
MVVRTGAGQEAGDKRSEAAGAYGGKRRAGARRRDAGLKTRGTSNQCETRFAQQTWFRQSLSLRAGFSTLLRAGVAISSLRTQDRFVGRSWFASPGMRLPRRPSAGLGGSSQLRSRVSRSDPLAFTADGCRLAPRSGREPHGLLEGQSPAGAHPFRPFAPQAGARRAPARTGCTGAVRRPACRRCETARTVIADG